MDSIAFYLLLLVSLTAVAISPTTTSATTIGVTYSTSGSISGSVQLSPDRIAEKIVSMKIPAVRLLDSNPKMIRAFADTNITLFLSVPNPLVRVFATNRSLAMNWVNRHVLPFYPRTNISIISVGNDAISYSPDDSLFLLGAMQNVRRSLKDLRIHKISVSTTFSFFNIVPTAFPPSAAQFLQPNGELIIRPILQFLERTNSSFLINLYPYNTYKSSCSFTLGFAIFEDSPYSFTTDVASGITYRNMFDLMLDFLISAMAAMGHGTLPVIVAEVGWPSSGIDAGEVDASLINSGMFLKSLVAHLSSGTRTTLGNEGPSEVYIFDFVDKDTKQSVRNWGILYPNLTSKYGLLLSESADPIPTSVVGTVMHIIGRVYLSIANISCIWLEASLAVSTIVIGPEHEAVKQGMETLAELKENIIIWKEYLGQK